MKTRSTYHADCLCGKPITSETRVTACTDCERILVFEWGGEPVTAEGLIVEELIALSAAGADPMQMHLAKQKAIQKFGEKPKAKGASA